MSSFDASTLLPPTGLEHGLSLQRCQSVDVAPDGSGSFTLSPGCGDVAEEYARQQMFVRVERGKVKAQDCLMPGASPGATPRRRLRIGANRARIDSTLGLIAAGSRQAHVASGAALLEVFERVERIEQGGADLADEVGATDSRGACSEKSLLGLYSMYMLTGMIHGWFTRYLCLPICFYIFGPVGPGGNVSYAQCGISVVIHQLPWCFKMFYGLLIDQVHLFGTRRRGWIIFGWTIGLALLVYLALVCEELVEKQEFTHYVVIATAVCACYLISDVAGDGLSVELSQQEPEETRGSILVTGQMVRFGSGMVSNVIGLLAMNGPSYCGDACTGSEFHFQLSFGAVHLLMVALAIPLFVVMVFTLEDAPVLVGTEPVARRSLNASLKEMWGVFQSRSMLSIILLTVGLNGVGGIGNPARSAISSIVSMSTFWVTLSSMVGTVLFVLGVMVFKKWFLHRNWRVTALWTGSLHLLDVGFMLMTIHNTFGISQSAWFVALGPGMWIAEIVAGIKWQIFSLAVLEIAPPGLEATTLEVYCALAHGAGTLAGTITNNLIPVFHINDISHTTYNAPGAPVAEFNRDMVASTLFNGILTVGALSVFLWFQPQTKEQTRDWNKQWNNRYVGGLGLLVVLAVTSYATITACIQLFQYA